MLRVLIRSSCLLFPSFLSVVCFLLLLLLLLRNYYYLVGLINFLRLDLRDTFRIGRVSRLPVCIQYG